MVARSQGGGRFIKCSSSGGQAKPHNPATSQQPEVPTGTAIIERGHRGVPKLGGAPEDDPAGDPINQALGPSVWPTQSRQREKSNGHRFATITFRLGSNPQIQNRKLANRVRMPVPEPPSHVRISGGPIELLLPPRTAPQRGEINQDQDGDG